MSAVIIYDTKYGHTATYANWIADELHISKYRLDEIGALDLSTYDTIIFGGPIFNGRIKIANLALMSRLWTGFFGTERCRTPKIFQNPDFSLKRRDFWGVFVGGTGLSPAGERKRVV